MSKLQHNFRILFAIQFFFFWMFAGSDLKSQSHYMLDQLGGFSSSGKVYIQWTLRKGTTCYGIGIYRSVNGTDFDRIGEIAGECGSSETPQTYNFTDENPVPGRLNYYVLELGIWGRTEPSLPLFVANSDSRDYRIIPHPITEEGKIYFRNPEFKPHTLTMASLAGKIVLQQSSSTDVFHIVLNSSALPVVLPTQTEPYAFYISSENEILTHSGIILLHR
jgi:hypothetical protein